MTKTKLQYLIWPLCLLVCLQVGWLGFRVDKLKDRRLAREKEKAEALKQAQAKLLAVSEPEVEEQLPRGGRLFLKRQESTSSGQLNLQIWGQADQPVNRVDLRIFWPQDQLKLISPHWQKEGAGTAFWSRPGQFFKPAGLKAQTRPNNQSKQVVTLIEFKILKPGRAEIGFDFGSESQLDSNLINLNGRDILEEVEGLSLEL